MKRRGGGHDWSQSRTSSQPGDGQLPGGGGSSRGRSAPPGSAESVGSRSHRPRPRRRAGVSGRCDTPPRPPGSPPDRPERAEVGEQWPRSRRGGRGEGPPRRPPEGTCHSPSGPAHRSGWTTRSPEESWPSSGRPDPQQTPGGGGEEVREGIVGEGRACPSPGQSPALLD